MPSLTNGQGYFWRVWASGLSFGTTMPSDIRTFVYQPKAYAFDYSRFLPLEVGNQWHYSVTNKAGMLVGFEIFTVKRDTVLAGLPYGVIYRRKFSSDGQRTGGASCAVHAGSSSDDPTRFERLEGNCDIRGCFPLPALDPTRFPFGPPAVVQVGGLSYPTESTISSGSGGGHGGGFQGWWALIAADIGTYQCRYERAETFPTEWSATTVHTLDYAKVGAKLYGQKIITNSESSPGVVEGLEVGSPHPNPATAQFALNIETAIPNNVEVALFDILGRRVFGIETVWIPDGGLRHKVDLSSVSAGVYVISVQIEGQTPVLRTVVRQ